MSEASAQIDALVAGLDDWRGNQLAEIRRLFHQAVPDVVETWKWMGSPVWESDGILAVGNAHQAKVKLTFPQGAQLADPGGVFNAGLGGKAWRAIDRYRPVQRDDPAEQRGHADPGPVARSPVARIREGG